MVMSNPRPVYNQNCRTKAIATSTPIPTTCFIGTLSAEEEYYVRAEQNGTSPTRLSLIELVGNAKLQIRTRNFDNDVSWVFFHGHTAIAIVARSTNGFKFNVKLEVRAVTTDKSSPQPV